MRTERKTCGDCAHCAASYDMLAQRVTMICKNRDNADIHSTDKPCKEFTPEANHIHECGRCGCRYSSECENGSMLTVERFGERRRHELCARCTAALQEFLGGAR